MPSMLQCFFSFCIFSTILVIGGNSEGKTQAHRLVFSIESTTNYADLETLGDYSDEGVEDDTNSSGNSDQSIETEDLYFTRGRVLFDYEFEGSGQQRESLETEKHVDSNYNLIESKISKRIFSFEDPENKAKSIRMTAEDINQIFNKRKFTKNKNKRLTKSDRKKALECRKKDKLFFQRDKKCYHPLAQEPCRTANKWFVAHKTRLDGVCRIKPCLGDNKLVSLNGTCVSYDGDNCPGEHNRVYLNIDGKGYCGCQDGFSKDSRDGSCYRNYLQGPCSQSQTWVNANCLEHSCPPGNVFWRDKQCHPLANNITQCLQSSNGVLKLQVCV